MAHPRQNIRDAIKSILLGATDCGQNVFENRSATFFPTELPALVIATETETSTAQDLQGRKYLRALTVTVTAHVQVSEDSSADIAMDNIALQVEQAVQANSTFNGTVYSALLTGTQLAFSGEGDAFTGHIILTFNCQYIS